VDCERTDAIEERIVVGGVGEWDSLAGREDSVAGDGGSGGDGERRRVDESDDGRGGDDDYDDADNDDDDWFRHKCSLRIYYVYV
jgi:hypothetical protein